MTVLAVSMQAHTWITHICVRWFRYRLLEGMRDGAGMRYKASSFD